MGRTASPDEEGTLASILGPIQEPRDYLPIIYRRLTELATRWMQEHLKLNSKEQPDVVVAYAWILDNMNWLLQEIKTERTLFFDNSRNEAVYERLESTIQAGQQVADLKQGKARATFEQLSSELAALIEDLRAQE